MYDDALGDIHSRLRRLPGVCNLKSTAIGAERISLDFTLGFPEGRLVDFRRKRSTGIGNSSFIFAPAYDSDDDGEYVVEEFLVRLPPLPKSEYSQSEIEAETQDTVSEIELPDGVDFKVVNEEKALWPHIEWRCGVNAEPLPTSESSRISEALYQRHRNRFFDQSKTV